MFAHARDRGQRIDERAPLPQSMARRRVDGGAPCRNCTGSPSYPPDEFDTSLTHPLAKKELVFLGIVAGHAGQTILVFSQFNAVLERLLWVLAENGIVNVALFTGETTDRQREGKYYFFLQSVL